LMFTIVSKIDKIETVAVGNHIREINDGTICLAEIHWYEAHGIGKKEFKIKKFINGSIIMKNFVICINNKDFEVSLEKKKLYEFLYDKESDKKNLIRIVDESGEDYLYPKDYFVPLDIPEILQKKLEFA